MGAAVLAGCKRDERGTPIRAVGLMLDIQEQKQQDWR